MEDVGEDRISKLPESIIHHVLSLLPLKCAVSTTVLSKTWKNLWVSIPVFDFREWRSITPSPGTEVTVETRNANVLIRQKDTDKFMDFLDSTLFSNINMSTIQKFCLCCDKFFDVIRVREWITGLIKRKVEELMLTVNFPRANLVPLDLFTCESLTMLYIDFVKQHVLDFPQSVSLPRLKKLRLSYVLFKVRAATQKFFSNYPIMEELVLCKCSQWEFDVISFSAPRLKFFALNGTFKLQRLCYNLRVEIDAPNLVSIEYGGWLPNEFIRGSFPSLVEAGFHHVRENKTTLDSLSKFVRLCSNIKLLKASSMCFQLWLLTL